MAVRSDRPKMRRKRLPAAARSDIQRTRQIARNEMALGLMSFFRPLPDGAQRREVRIEQEFAGTRLRLMGVEMSAFEQGIFLGLLAIGLRGGELQTAAQAGLLPSLPHPNAPTRATPDQNVAADAPTIEIKSSLAELCRVAGLPAKPGSATREAIKLGFQRLSGVTVFVESAGGAWGITHLLSGGMGDAGGGVTVRLNPRSTGALLDRRSYAAIDMPAYRRLSTPTSRVLYAWLCAWFSGGLGTRQIALERLEVHAFGSLARAKATRSKRRAAIVAALAEVGPATKGEMLAVAQGRVATVTRISTERGEVRQAVNLGTPSGEPALSESGPLQDAATSSSGRHAAPGLGSLPHKPGDGPSAHYPAVACANRKPASNRAGGTTALPPFGGEGGQP